MKTCKKCGTAYEKEKGHVCEEEKKEVESYILSQREEIQPLLREIREIILSAVPGVYEKISWKMPTFYRTHDIIHFAAFKNHWGLYPGPVAIEHFKERFEGLTYSKGAVQFPYDMPLDKELIYDMTRWCHETGNHHQRIALTYNKRGRCVAMIFYPEGVEKNERGVYRSMWHELQSLRNYQFYKGGLNKEEFHKTYCPGCVPRGKNCTHMGHKCSLLGEGLVRFCFQCEKYPCKDLRALDKRYREKYHMSMLENLEEIRVEGMEAFLQNQNLKWICPNCGELRCAHNGLCLFCELETLQKNKKYCWNREKKT